MGTEYKIESYSFFGLLILFSGVLREYVYFKFFNLSILPFLEPYEVFSFFFDIIFYFAIFLFVNVFIFYKFHNLSLSQLNSQEEPSFCRRLKEYRLFAGMKLLCLFILIIMALVIHMLRTDANNRELIIWIVLIIISIFLNPYVILELIYFLRKAGLKISRSLVISFISTINLILFSAGAGVNEAYKVKNKSYYIGTEIEMEGCSFVSNHSQFYIGKTNKYCFIYSKPQNQTTIIPIEKINSIKFKK